MEIKVSEKELEEFESIRILLRSKDKESVKLGRDLFYTTDLYKALIDGGFVFNGFWNDDEIPIQKACTQGFCWGISTIIAIANGRPTTRAIIKPRTVVNLVPEK